MEVRGFESLMGLLGIGPKVLKRVTFRQYGKSCTDIKLPQQTRVKYLGCLSYCLELLDLIVGFTLRLGNLMKRITMEYKTKGRYSI